MKDKLSFATPNHIKNPCYGCEDRELGCHSSCEKYAEFKIKLDEFRSGRDTQLYLDKMKYWGARRSNIKKNTKGWKRQ